MRLTRATISKMHPFLGRPSHPSIPRGAILLLMTMMSLTWSNLAVCGEIHDAARDGDLARVKTLLNDSPNLVFSRDETGRTPLMWAAWTGHRDVVELLLAGNADVNAQDNNGITPLRMAMNQSDKDVVELLRQYGGHE